MQRFLTLPATLAAAALLSAALAAPHAMAGHLNPVLEATLDGRSEIAGNADNRAIVGDPNAKGKAYVFGIDGDPATLCYMLVDIAQLAEVKEAPGNGRMAHIHEGAPGSNGPVIAVLAWPQDGQAGDCLTEGEGQGTPGVKFPTGEPGIVQRILNHPQDFYVNVHNSAYPSGAIRGQLRESGSHKH